MVVSLAVLQCADDCAFGSDADAGTEDDGGG
jgi:hypothetical protein